MSYTVLITGANRGVGLEFVKQYCADGWRVIACCRNPDKALELQKLQKQFSTLSIHPLEVTDEQQIQALTQELKNTPIDLLINNAGVFGDSHIKFGQNTVETLQNVFTINAIAPLKISEAFVENVAKSQLKKIVTISSVMGSISEKAYGGAYAYSASKAAVNMLMRIAAIELEPRGIKVLLLDPGWVKTAMGGPDARISTETSVTGMRQVIAQFTETSTFLSYDGTCIAW